MVRVLKCSFIMLMIASAAVLGGCSSAPIKTGPAISDETDDKDRQITDLQDEIDRLNEENAKASKELRKLEDAKKALESKLSKEIGEYKAKLEMTSRGLVITFLNEILFDPGKDEIKEDGQKTLKDVSKVLNSEVSGSEVAVEGHTDTQPIKYSGWKSNWELSSARALSVVHFLIDKGEVAPKRLSAVGYGEYRSVADNKTTEGQGKNRRVEIVILPAELKKVGK